MTFSGFLSACFHALILLGIGFAIPQLDLNKAPITLDVVMATNFSPTPPSDPDFKAQANQVGGGKSKTSKPPRTASQSEMPAPDARATAEPLLGAETPQTASKRALTSQKGKSSVARSETQAEIEPAPRPINTATMMKNALEIAALQAEIDLQRELEAKEPRRKVVAPSTVSAVDAVWMDSWRKRVEKTGKKHFPTTIKQARELIIRVDVNADGTLRHVAITQSSGDRQIDKAAMNIIHKAQPFNPFSKEMKKQQDVLQIVSLWRFEPGKIFSTEAQ
jgi:protein TonB